MDTRSRTVQGLLLYDRRSVCCCDADHPFPFCLALSLLDGMLAVVAKASWNHDFRLQLEDHFETTGGSGKV